MPKKVSSVCDLCGTPIGKSKYIHSATPKHLTALKKAMAIKKKESVSENGYFKY